MFAFIHIFSKTKTDSVRDALRSYIPDAVNVATIIFKTIGTDSPQAYSLRKIYSPAPPFQCCVPIFILFQAATVSAYSTTTLIGEGPGREEIVGENLD